MHELPVRTSPVRRSRLQRSRWLALCCGLPLACAWLAATHDLHHAQAPGAANAPATANAKAEPDELYVRDLGAAHTLRANGTFQEAGLAFDALLARAAGHTREPEALLYTGLAWFDAGRSASYLYRSTPEGVQFLAKARERLETLLKRFPKAVQAERAQYMLAATLELQGDVEGALAQYAKFGDQHAQSASYAARALVRRADLQLDVLRAREAHALLDLQAAQHPFAPDSEDERHARWLRQIAARIGETAPSMSGGEWVGEPAFSSLAQADQLVALAFTAPGCRACPRENPFVAELAKRFGPRGLRTALVVSQKPVPTRAVVEFMIKSEQIELPLWMDDGSFAAAMGVDTTPQVALIDAAGRVRWRGHPSSLRDSTLEQLLAE
jgi:hypothetical protein